MVAKCNLILYLSIILTNAYISYNCFYISIIRSYQLSSINKSKKKIINLMILIIKKKYFYNNILIKKIANACYIKKEFFQ